MSDHGVKDLEGDEFDRLAHSVVEYLASNVAMPDMGGAHDWANLADAIARIVREESRGLLPKVGAVRAGERTPRDIQVLRPCPFCLNPEVAMQQDRSRTGLWHASCLNCGATGPVAVMNAYVASSRWNQGVGLQSRTPRVDERGLLHDVKGAALEEIRRSTASLISRKVVEFIVSNPRLNWGQIGSVVEEIVKSTLRDVSGSGDQDTYAAERLKGLRRSPPDIRDRFYEPGATPFVIDCPACNPTREIESAEPMIPQSKNCPRHGPYTAWVKRSSGEPAEPRHPDRTAVQNKEDHPWRVPFFGGKRYLSRPNNEGGDLEYARDQGSPLPPFSGNAPTICRCPACSDIRSRVVPPPVHGEPFCPICYPELVVPPAVSMPVGSFRFCRDHGPQAAAWTKAQLTEGSVEGFQDGAEPSRPSAEQIEVFSRSDCPYQYCSNPDKCKSAGSCQHVLIGHDNRPPEIFHPSSASLDLGKDDQGDR